VHCKQTVLCIQNFAYISGKNSKNETIPMTAPVTFRRDHATDGYLVGFFIPSTYDTAKDIPKPRDSSIGIVSFPKDATFAVVSFGGFAGPNDFKDHQVHTLNMKNLLYYFACNGACLDAVII
jgi:SOUL heme-binding protein